MEDIKIDLTRHKEPIAEPVDLSKETLVAQTFSVKGMTCSSCVNTVERTLNQIPGVKASVNFASETVHIMAPATIKAETIVKKIYAAGYDAALLDDASDPALHRKGAARALIFATIFAVPAITISMVMSWYHSIGMWMMDITMQNGWPMPPNSEEHFASYLVLLLTAPLILFVAWPIHRAALRNILHPTMDTLVSLGSISAYGWSIYATLSGNGDIYTEVAAGVLLFIILGRYLEARAKKRAASALATLLALGEKEVTVIRNGNEVVIPISHLLVGDEFIVKPGARIATDGLVISGNSTVDNSMITGESLPVEIKAGDTVIGSALNNNGRLIVRATRIGSDTELARITAMVVTAQGTKAPIQALADRVSAFFVPIVTLAAIATGLVWYYIVEASITVSISHAITVLVIACPCALGLATPVALLVASGRGALRGIVIRHPRVLEAARNIDTVILDKTGTLTTGAMKVQSVVIPVSAQKTLGASFAGLLDEVGVLSLAMAVQSNNDHPIARAMSNYAIAHGAQKLEISEFTQTPGSGVAARVQLAGRPVVVIIGSPESVAHSTTPFDPVITHAINEAQSHSHSIAVMAVDGIAVAAFAVGDVLKSDAQAAVAAMVERGLSVWMVTGDRPESAAAIASAVGIKSAQVISAATPATKIEKVKELQSQGQNVMMVGDGVNDAAALAQANLSIAMGTGTDTAIATADITVMRPQLHAVIDALDLSKKTLRTIKGNLIWAFAYNAVGLPLAALGIASPMYAAAAMALSSLFVVTNSLRIR